METKDSANVFAATPVEELFEELQWHLFEMRGEMISLQCLVLATEESALTPGDDVDACMQRMEDNIDQHAYGMKAASELILRHCRKALASAE